MTRRQKNLLIVIGLSFIFVSLFLVAYSLWPLPGVVEKLPLSPDLFALPKCPRWVYVSTAP